MARRPDIARAGFTVLELLVVMAIVAGLAVALTAGIRRVRASDLRAATSELAQTLRAAFNLSASTGKHHRVVFDLDEQVYQLEMCEGKVLLAKEDKESGPEDAEREQAEIERAMELLQGKQGGAGGLGGLGAGGLGGLGGLAGGLGGLGGLGGGGLGGLGGGLGGGESPEVQTAASPGQAADRAAALAGVRLGRGRCGPPEPTPGIPARGKPHKLTTERGIRIERIHVQHLEDPQDKGRVTINFFPLGYSEKAVVELESSEDDRYVLLVHGLTGRVEFQDGDWRKPEQHMLRDAAGDRAEERE